MRGMEKDCGGLVNGVRRDVRGDFLELPPGQRSAGKDHRFS